MKKCSRCNTYFTDGVRDLVCLFHAAPWIDVHTPGKGAARIGVWSCCKEVSRDSPGCLSGKHVEDKVTEENLRRFEVFAVKGTRKEAIELLDTEFLQKNLGHTHVHYMDHSVVSPVILEQIKNISSNNNNNNVKLQNATIGQTIITTNTNGNQTRKTLMKPEAPPEEGFIFHSVQLTDTLPGIALRYNTTVAYLKQLNKLFSNTDLYKLKTLIVPDPEFAPHPVSLSPSPSSSLTSNQQSRQINKLAMVENICKEEALFYLADNNWDFSLARASFGDDIEWAAAEWARLRGKGKFREWLGDSDVQTVAVVACGALLVVLCVLL